MAPPPPFGANSAAARDIANVLHPYTDLKTHQEVGPTVIARGKGVRVWDDAGKEYIESVAGLWCASSDSKWAMSGNFLKLTESDLSQRRAFLVACLLPPGGAARSLTRWPGERPRNPDCGIEHRLRRPARPA